MSIEAGDVEAVKRWGFREFVRITWRHVDTSPLKWNWHLDAICLHLEAIQKRQITDLVINQPPATSKSSLSSVLFPVWVWTVDPTHRFIFATHDSDLSLRLARKSRSLIESQWFQARWPEIQLPHDNTTSTAVSLYESTRGGERASVVVPAAKVTGNHCDTCGIDDPNNPEDVNSGSKLALERTLKWWDETMSSRFRDLATSARFCTMQRLHEKDLAGEMIRTGATVLCLPMEFKRSHPHRYTGDPRTQEGELLDPNRHPRVEVDKLKKKLGPTAAAAQLGQEPFPATGTMLKQEYFRKRWTRLPNNGRGGIWTQSWDMTLKGKDDSDYVAGGVWWHYELDHYLVHQVCKQMGFAETCREVVKMSDTFVKAYKKLIEDKANGPAIEDMLRSEVPGITMVNPEGGKEARANASEPIWADEHVILPHETDAVYEGDWISLPEGVSMTGAPWVPELIAQHISFPRGANDDMVDQASQYSIHRGGKRRKDRLAAAMNAMLKRDETT